MTITHRRIARASLESPMDDGGDRNVMPMQTIVTIDADPPNHMWLAETAWDGQAIGDIQVYRNMNAIGDGATEPRDGNGAPVVPDWQWWGGVPRGRVKSYRFAANDVPTPQTADLLPFEISGAQRETKPRKAAEGRPGQGSGS